MNAFPSPSAPRTPGPNCYQCRHFAVSWDPALPYSCKRMGFKSRALPAIEVLRVDGLPCQGFEAKAGQGAAPRSVAPVGVERVHAPQSLPTESLPDLARLRRMSGFRRTA